MNPFNTKDSLDKHTEYCSDHDAVKIELPKKGTMYPLRNYPKDHKSKYRNKR